MTFTSTAEEIIHWADQCRRWARGARTSDQRLTLQTWEKLFRQAASDAEYEVDKNYLSNLLAPTKP